jgi:hypothetical protein
MTAIAQRDTPQLGIFWVVQTPAGEARILTAGCPLDQAEPYGDCLTYGPGHYEIWDHWRRDRTVEPALRALVRSYDTRTGHADASSSTGRAICSSSTPIASSSPRQRSRASKPNFICRWNAPRSNATYTIRAQRHRMG